MPRGGRGGGGGGRRGSSNPPASRSPPPARRDSHPAQPAPPRGGGPGSRGMGIGGAIAGSFIGSALGSVLGNSISQRMYEGRDPETGAWEDPNQIDDNPCKKELDYYLDCSKYSGNALYCKSGGESLKACADRNKDYFQET